MSYLNAKEINIKWARETFYYKDGRVYYKVACRRKPKGSLAAGDKPDASGYRRISVKKSLFKEHRIVWALFHDTIPPILDHINGDKLDNRIENLRPSNLQMNRFNSASTRGVSYHQKQEKWFTRIRYNGKLIHLGCYEDEELAEFVYQQAKEKWIEPLYSEI